MDRTDVRDLKRMIVGAALLPTGASFLGFEMSSGLGTLGIVCLLVGFGYLLVGLLGRQYRESDPTDSPR